MKFISSKSVETENIFKAVGQDMTDECVSETRYKLREVPCLLLSYGTLPEALLTYRKESVFVKFDIIAPKLLLRFLPPQ